MYAYVWLFVYGIIIYVNMVLFCIVDARIVVYVCMYRYVWLYTVVYACMHCVLVCVCMVMYVCT